MPRRRLGRKIGEKSGLGVDLGGDGVTANDDHDADLGANQLQNHPRIKLAGLYGGFLTIDGPFHSSPRTEYRLDFYWNDSRDPSGRAQGQRWLGFTRETTDASGRAEIHAVFPILLPGSRDILPGDYVTVTASDPAWNTSEFSEPRQVRRVRW